MPFDGRAIEDRREHLVELIGGDARHRRFPVDEFFLHHVQAMRTAARPVRLPLRVWSMNSLPSWMVNSKSCTSLKCVSRVLRTCSSSAKAFGSWSLQLGHGFGRAHAGHDVFALRVDEEFAVEHLLAGGRIAREGDAGAGVLAGVAKDHRLHVDGRAPFGGMLYLRR